MFVKHLEEIRGVVDVESTWHTVLARFGKLRRATEHLVVMELEDGCGYRCVDGSDGVKLKYSYKDEVPIMNKKKYNQEQVSLVIDKYQKLKNYSGVKRLISTQNNLNISLPTIKKMVAGEYWNHW